MLHAPLILSVERHIALLENPGTRRSGDKAGRGAGNVEGLRSRSQQTNQIRVNVRRPIDNGRAGGARREVRKLGGNNAARVLAIASRGTRNAVHVNRFRNTGIVKSIGVNLLKITAETKRMRALGKCQVVNKLIDDRVPTL